MVIRQLLVQADTVVVTSRDSRDTANKANLKANRAIVSLVIRNVSSMPLSAPQSGYVFRRWFVRVVVDVKLFGS